jgi:hypothetical protein
MRSSRKQFFGVVVLLLCDSTEEKNHLSPFAELEDALIYRYEIGCY